MRASILRGFSLILVGALLLCGVIAALIFDLKLTEEKEDDMLQVVGVMASEFDPDGDHDAQASQFSEAANGIRVTIIAGDGTVTGDSEVDYTTMENHADREEIRQAAGASATVLVRNSETLGKKLIYAVQKTQDAYYIRLSDEYSGVMADLVSFAPAILGAALVALLFALYFTRRFTDSITGPIIAMNESLRGVKDGTATLDAASYPYEELRDMAEKINALAGDVSRHIGQIQAEKDKIDYLLDHMLEGFLLLDRKGKVLIINASACARLGCDKSAAGRELLYVTRNTRLLETVRNVQDSGRNQRLDLEMDGKIIEVQCIVVGESYGDIDGGMILILTDVTEVRNAVKMRRDFFTNASHELKTPITSIKGSAELLCSDLPIPEEQRQELLARMGQETERMCTLIGDIIMINRLESGDIPGDRSNLDFGDVVRECCGEVRPMASQNQLQFYQKIDAVPMYASARSLHELTSNLLMNAVKYNRPGGAVEVTLEREGGTAVLSVRNDGEPIPPEHQGRVFERFYRVDRGRSKTVGGTGLGLSIVKHVVDAMGGTIDLVSNDREGTRFTVRLPIPAQESAGGAEE